MMFFLYPMLSISASTNFTIPFRFIQWEEETRHGFSIFAKWNGIVLGECEKKMKIFCNGRKVGVAALNSLQDWFIKKYSEFSHY